MSPELPPVVHSTFRIERAFRSPPARVFRAFADPEAKRRWFVEGEGFTTLEYRPAFEVGATEFSRFRYGDSPEMTNACLYQDIVPDRRLVFCYRMTMGGAIMSVSLTTMEFVAQEGGTLLVHTEQGTYLDGSDDGTHREAGTRELLEALAREVGG